MSQILEKRSILREAFTLTRMVIHDLRGFLETENYNYLERAYRLVEHASSKKEYGEEMAGLRDLRENLKEIHEKLSEKNDLTEEEHAELSHQVVYAIVRANLIANGLNFKLKRMRRR